jgi:hypothetical protein
MSFPQIDIRQTFGRIGLLYTPQQWEIHTQQADMDLHVSQADVEIHQELGELTIDQTDAFAQEGLMKFVPFAFEQARQAQQIAAQGVEETARIGDEFAHIERRGNQPFNDWVMRYANHTVETVPALVPAPFSVHIHYEPKPVEEHVSLGRVKLHVTVHRPEVRFSPSAVKAYEEQKASITVITPTLSSLDLKV